MTSTEPIENARQRRCDRSQTIVSRDALTYPPHELLVKIRGFEFRASFRALFFVGATLTVLAAISLWNAPIFSEAKAKIFSN
ncbi:hypothetical protein [Rhodobacter lacus]|uniref:Uncharacterized protein n=1 Tax=Rhodobacter lacus TaxID=1641972 RepID=A0ABW5AAI4_9RHOB